MADATGTLTKEELETVITYCGDRADDALAEGSREELRKVLSEISDICDPDSILDVDVENATVEVTGWDEPENDEDDPEE